MRIKINFKIFTLRHEATLRGFCKHCNVLCTSSVRLLCTLLARSVNFFMFVLAESVSFLSFKQELRADDN